MHIKPLPRQHYPNAPIVEAVIAIGFVLPDESGVKDLLKVHDAVKSEYPQRRDWLSVEVRVDSAEYGKSEPEHVGYHMISNDGKRMIRISKTNLR